MANKSGTLTFSNGGGGVVNLTVDWVSTGNDSNNTSSVNAKLYITASAQGNTLNGSYISINGSSVPISTYINSGSSVIRHFLGEHTVTVNHDGNGNSTIQIAACLVWNGYMWNGSGVNVSSISGSQLISLQTNNIGTVPSGTSISLNKTSVAEGSVTATANTSVAVSAGTVYYRFAYSTNAGSSWTETGWSTSNTYSLNITNVSRGSWFYFRTEAKNDRGSSGWSNAVSIKANSAPTAPTRLYVDNVRVVGNCTMTWNKSTDAEGHSITYKVYIKKNGGDWTYLNSTSSTSYTYNSTNDVAGTKYNYKVEAHDSLGAYSSEESGEFIKATPPSAVKVTLNKTSVAEGNVTATAAYTCNYPRGTTQYQFSYYYDGIGWQDQAWQTDDSIILNVSKKRGVKWHVKTRVKNDAGTSAWSTEVNITSNSLPTKAQGLSVSPKYPIDSMTLSWNKSTDANNNAITYKVYLQKNEGPWSLLASTTGTSVTYNNSQDAFGTKYKFKVEAYDTFNVCDTASESSEFFKPTPPTMPVITQPTNAFYELDIPIKWNKSNFYSISGYYVIEKSINGGSWTTVHSNTILTSSTFSINNISRGDTIQFRAKAVNEAGQESSWYTGTTIKRNRLPNAVTNIKPASSGYVLNIINFSWDAAEDPDGQDIYYNLYVSKNGGAYEYLYQTTNTTFAWAIPAKDPGEYSYRLKVVTVDTLGAENEAIGPLILKPTPPTKPTNLGPSSGYYENYIDLTWTHSNWYEQIGIYMLKIFVDGELYTEAEVPSTSNVYKLDLTEIPRGSKITYNIRAKNEFDQQSEWVISSVNLYHNHIPGSPEIIAPLTGSTVYSYSPKIIIKSGTDADEQKMTVNVKYNGSTYNSKTHSQYFSKDNIGNEEYIIFKHTSPLQVGNNTIEVTCNDGLINSSKASTTINIKNNIEDVLSNNIITSNDINSRLTAIDKTRLAYRLPSYNLLLVNPNSNFITAENMNTCIAALKDLIAKIDSYHIDNKFTYSYTESAAVKNETIITAQHFNQLSSIINTI